MMEAEILQIALSIILYDGDSCHHFCHSNSRQMFKKLLFTGACFGILKIFTLMNVGMLAKQCIEIKAGITDLNCVQHFRVFYQCFRSIKASRMRCVSVEWK